jgi:hypothetical protein
MTDMKQKTEIHIFNILFFAMGTLLFGVACWIALSVSTLPRIEQKMDDFIAAASARFTGTDEKIADHEARLRIIEGKPHQ